MQTLDYIERTREQRGQDGPVFIASRFPYNAVVSSTVSRILEEAIVLAGLSTKELSANYFRPTGATTVIAQNLNPEVVRKVGRWKSLTIMYIVKQPLNNSICPLLQNRFCFEPCYSQ